MEDNLIYEVVDVTDGDVYYTLGYFKTLNDARVALIEVENPNEIIENEIDDYAKVEVREHKIVGWGNEYKTVYKIQWTNKYNEATDDNEWIIEEGLK